MCARSVRLRRGSALRCGPGVLISPGGEALSVLRSAAAPRWVGSARLGSPFGPALLRSQRVFVSCADPAELPPLREGPMELFAEEAEVRTALFASFLLMGSVEKGSGALNN